VTRNSVACCGRPRCPGPGYGTTPSHPLYGKQPAASSHLHTTCRGVRVAMTSSGRGAHRRQVDQLRGRSVGWSVGCLMQVARAFGQCENGSVFVCVCVCVLASPLATRKGWCCPCSSLPPARPQPAHQLSNRRPGGVQKTQRSIAYKLGPRGDWPGR